MRIKQLIATFLLVLAVNRPLAAQVEKTVADAEGIT